jgi:hypothetical protein
MHVSVLKDIHEPDGAGLLCSRANSVAMMELIFGLRWRKETPGLSGIFGLKGDEDEAN